MNLSEINWDINASGSWPVPVKIATGALICALVAAGWIYYDTLDQLAELEKKEKEENTLKADFETKQKKSANLQDYRDQLLQIEGSLGEMLRQMPTKAEVANLLVDISQTGLASGLEFKLFKPSPEINRDFYMELPISIEVVGQYDELALFISGLAALPRIVTIHDVNITPLTDKKSEGDNNLKMTAIVKTYNEVDSAAAAAAAKGKSKPLRKVK